MSSARLLSFRLVIILALLCAGGILAYSISQETPLGSLTGTAIAQQIGTPVDSYAFLTSTKKVDGRKREYGSAVKKDGSFSFKNVVAGQYVLYVFNRYHSIDDVIVDITEATTNTINVELLPVKPKLYAYMNQHVFSPEQQPEFTCDGFLDEDELNVRIYEINPTAYLFNYAGSLHRLLGLNQSYYWGNDNEKRVSLSANPNLKFVRSNTLPIKQKETDGGFTQRYKIEELEPGLYLTEVSAGGLQSLEWLLITSLGLVTKSAPGRMLNYVVNLQTGNPVVEADVSMYAESRLVAHGKTGEDGLLSAKIPDNFHSYTEAIAVARKGQSIAFISTAMSSLPDSDTSVYVYTDRPVYRPGQKVFFKGIMRNRVDSGYKTPVGKDITVQVRDPQDTLIQRVSTKTDKFGGFSDSLRLPPDALTGDYSVSVSSGAQMSSDTVASFSVSAYRKPEFSVKTTFDKKRYSRGEWVKAKISVNYYFGAPVPNADIEYRVSNSPYWLIQDTDEYGDAYDSDYGDYSYSYWNAGGRIRTDANGEATITFRASWSQSETLEELWGSDQMFEVSSSVTDAAGSYANGEGRVVVTRGSFAIMSQTDRQIISPGSKVKVSIEARDFDLKPVKNQKITVSLIKRDFNENQEFENKVIERRGVVTDAHGNASIHLSADEEGEFYILASARDSHRNYISHNSNIFVFNDDGQLKYNIPESSLKILTDKRSYAPGETATAILLSHNLNATALVCVEGARLYEARTVYITRAATKITIPILDTYKPNCYINVCIVKGKEFMETEKKVNVSIGSQALKVDIKPDKSNYKPGAQATYNLKVTDSKGNPASATLSLGVVDEAIYAIQPDRTTPITDFFYSQRWNEVDTRFSFPSIYLSDPDKAGAALRDESPKIRMRKRFEDTAYWNPTIITDQSGLASVNFKWPDNLTTWRATARAATTATKFGQSQNTVISRQDMLVRLELPRFMVQKDRCKLVAAVHNYTNKDQRVKVRLKAPGLTIHDKLERSVSIRKNASARIEWVVSAPKPGSFTISVTAQGQTAGDAVQLDLPVKPHGEELISAANFIARAQGDSKKTINIRQDSITESTSFKITLAPSLASTLLGSLDYLSAYPYGCTEQTVSRFLPDVILSRSMLSLGINNPKLQAELPDMVRKGLARIYYLERSDGGWGWSEYGEADPWMTAYVTYALIQARDAGFAINDGVLERAISQLSKIAPSRKVRLYPRAFAAYVLALGGYDSSPVMEEIARRKNVNNEALAVLALGFNRVGQHDRAEAVLERLFDKAIVSGDIHWAGVSRWDGGGIEPTALALQALLLIKPDDSRAYDIVRWLMAQRYNNYWFSTRGTAMTLYAMAEFLGRTKELAADFDATVSVNGKTIRTIHFDKNSVYSPHVEVRIPNSELRKGRNTLVINKVGQGVLYYTTSLTQYTARDPIPAMFSKAGISIERSYYKPRPQYYSSRSARHLGSPIRRAKTGDILLVRLVINASVPVSHMLAEDFVPAGCEITDRGNILYDDWRNWWVGRDIRDDKVSFYIDKMDKGRKVVEYQIRAGFAGKFSALPAQFFSMYDPSVRATTGEKGFDIR